MKSITTRILILTLFTTLFIIITFSYVSYRFASSKFYDFHDQIINKGTTLWRSRFEGYFKQKEVAIDTIKHIIEHRFTLENLADAELLSNEFDYLSGIMDSMVEVMNYLNPLHLRSTSKNCSF